MYEVGAAVGVYDGWPVEGDTLGSELGNMVGDADGITLGMTLGLELGLVVDANTFRMRLLA